MKIHKIAAVCEARISLSDEAYWTIDYKSVTREHVLWMCHQLMKKEIKGKKAHRWLGWIQACMRHADAATDIELTELNR